MSVVEQYWAGVLKRLQAEVDNFNRIIGHQGEKGRENELSLSRILERLIPARYGVGSGLLIDASGGESRQLDIVVFEQNDEPAILAQTNQVLFPVENTRACVEVKTTADKAEWVDGGKKKSSVVSLSPASRVLPTFLFFAYQSNRTAATIRSYIDELATLDRDQRPDIFCVLELGLVGGRPDLLSIEPPDGEDYIFGITPLQVMESGVRKAGEYEVPPTGHWDEDILVRGTTYPIVRVLERDLVVEPSRALLLFCDALLVALGKRDGKVPAISHYITSVARDVLFVKSSD